MRAIVVLAILTISFLSCGKSKSENCEGPELDCTSIRCLIFASNFDFKVIDNTTGADLVFGSNPRYTSADIELYSDLARSVPLALTFDDNKKIIQTMTAKDEMYLVIKNTDVYKLTAEFKTETCCASRVKSLSIDGQLVCSCCSDVISFSVK
jgi:hypothetical protein